MDSGASFLTRLPLFADVSSDMLARLEHHVRKPIAEGFTSLADVAGGVSVDL